MVSARRAPPPGAARVGRAAGRIAASAEPRSSLCRRGSGRSRRDGRDPRSPSRSLHADGARRHRRRVHSALGSRRGHRLQGAPQRTLVLLPARQRRAAPLRGVDRAISAAFRPRPTTACRSPRSASSRCIPRAARCSSRSRGSTPKAMASGARRSSSPRAARRRRPARRSRASARSRGIPRRVAVVTSPDGAALHDIVAVVRRAAPSVRARGRAGGGAGRQRAGGAVRTRSSGSRAGADADVVIVGRGGGAREDLWAFNDERVARAVAACRCRRSPPSATRSTCRSAISWPTSARRRRRRPPRAAVPVPGRACAPRFEPLRDALASAAVARSADARDRMRHGDRRPRRGRRTDRRAPPRPRADVGGRLHALSPLATLNTRATPSAFGDGRHARGGGASHFARVSASRLVLRDGRVQASRPASRPHDGPGFRAARAPTEPSTFEEQLARLETIVDELEGDGLELDARSGCSRRGLSGCAP